MSGASLSFGQPAVLNDTGAQFFKQDVGAPLLVGIGLDQRVVETGGKVQVEVGADVFSFDQGPRHCPESHDGGVIHSGGVA